MSLGLHVSTLWPVAQPILLRQARALKVQIVQPRKVQSHSIRVDWLPPALDTAAKAAVDVPAMGA